VIRITGLLCALLALWLQFAAAAALAEVPVPSLTGAVVDLTGTLTPEQVRSLDAELRAFSERRGSQLAVLMVPTTKPEAIEQFAIRVAEQWKIGRKRIDDGVILVVAKDDRAVRIEVGYGLEGAIPDVVAKRIVEGEIVPRFRAGDFNGGVRAATTALMKVMEGEKLPEPARVPAGSQDHLQWLIWVLFMLVFLGGAVRRIFGRVFGSVITGGVVGAVAAFVIGSVLVGVVAGLFAFMVMLATGSGRGSYIGGPMGGWGGGGPGRGGFGGGFGGGGGGFGGGGASGRW
jgi:uncharacterized protein